ncbi:MAG: lipoate--protein ligase family protein [Leptolyngbya sp. SIO4C5]|nr:lipoate--protein ligase family protein [Leptolyngbya sp. SIO4C5]
MALDRWLLEQHRCGRLPSVLRFYRWQPATISLGYHQRRYPDCWRDLTWQGQPVPLVRRPSGGRAVLHQGDLTYAVITSDFTGSRQQVYQQICQFLLHGWRSLGVSLRYGTAGRGYIHHPGCFTTATAADLVLDDGTKVVGSAQYRQGNALLQHGSMPLRTEADLFCQVFGADKPPPDLSAVVGHLTDQQVIAALTASAQACWSIELKTQPLIGAEFQAAIQEAARWQVT